MNDLLRQLGSRGKILRRADEGYTPGSYQYATSSYSEEGIVNPDLIFYPVDDDDVKAAIKYATEKGIGIAIRTGGHHYTGASSAKGANIQLDLSQTYTDYAWQKDTVTVTVGISTTLGKFLGKLKKHGRFVPVGQCSYVNLGGHCQTGGYGHLIRSFGLLADHIVGVRIITADAEVRELHRGRESDKDLFYAVVGGSPGNFGVITHVTLKTLKDEDHPHSRGLYASTLYSRDKLEKLLNVMVDMGDDDDTPADYDFSITVTGEREAEQRPYSAIVVFAQWANLPHGKPYDAQLFNKIKDIINGDWRKPSHSDMIIDEEKPMSTLCSLWVFPIAREFQVPYFKRTYITESTTLKQDGWSKWASGRLDEIIVDTKDGLYACAQFSHVGGKHSHFRNNDRNHETSLSWRRDSTYACTMDVFYDPGNPQVKEKARQWAETNDKEAVGNPRGYFSKQDRRLLWGSYDLDLVAAREHYYDSPEKYDRLSAIKQHVDPNLIFTANKFAVGPRPAHVN